MKLRAAHLTHSRGMHAVGPQSRARQMRRVFASRVPAADWSRLFLAEGKSLPPEKRPRRIHQAQPSRVAPGDANAQPMGIGALAWRTTSRLGRSVFGAKTTQPFLEGDCGIGGGITLWRACAWEQEVMVTYDGNATQDPAHFQSRIRLCFAFPVVVLPQGYGGWHWCKLELHDASIGT